MKNIFKISSWFHLVKPLVTGQYIFYFCSSQPIDFYHTILIKLTYLDRRVHVRVIRKQKRQCCSASFCRSNHGWEVTVLHGITSLNKAFRNYLQDSGHLFINYEVTIRDNTCMTINDIISNICLGLSIGTAVQQELNHQNVAPLGSLMESRQPILIRHVVKTIYCHGLCERIACVYYYKNAISAHLKTHAAIENKQPAR